MTIQKNCVVTIDYTLTDQNGALIESSDGREPMTYLHGLGNIIPGLEASLEGRSAGESLQVSIPPAGAYGERDEEKIMSIPRTQFSGVDDIKEGMEFSVQSSMGEQVVTVTKVEKETVTIDANHPLAGKTLKFDVTIKGVRTATPEELEHGHVHHGGGDHS